MRTRQIATIESGILPEGRRQSATCRGDMISITDTLRACLRGDSFLIDDPAQRGNCYVIAKRVGKSIRTQKKDGRLRVFVL